MFNRSVDVDEETMEHEIFSMDEEEDAVELLDKTERERGEKYRRFLKRKNRMQIVYLATQFLESF